MMRIDRWMAMLLSAATFCLAPSASAETSGVGAAGFVVSLQQGVHAKPEQVYAAIGQIGKWWNSKHTWSGNAANLSLPLNAGACFCENWDNGSVQHAQVVFVKKNEMVRLQGGIGPLQDMAVNGVLTFAIAADTNGALLKLTYRINGSPNSALDQMAAPVDGVLTEQLHRLVAYVETGAPDGATVK